MIFLILSNFVLLAMIFVLVWGLSVKIKDASIVDILWGPACALPAVFTWVRTEGQDPRATLLTVLVCIWGARLGLYLAKRNLGHGEDYRYIAMRKKQGSDDAFARWSLTRVFLLQCAIAWFVSIPTQIGQLGGLAEIGVIAVLGTALFVVGLIFETVGDWQLTRFKADPTNKGRLMTQGLWSWTRHPNYFGDACVWTGLTMIALESSHGWVTILSPVLMIYFLVNVSGKALLEKGMDKKYPEYAAYKKNVSGFLPRPPSANPDA